MMEWMKRFFGAPTSSSTAKERLRMVLMTDHLALAPEIIENMKRDLVDVISRYVEIDKEKVEVNFEREDKALAMLANIPITNVNRPSPPPSTSSGLKAEGKASHSGPPPTRKRRRRKGVSATVPQAT